MALWDKGCHRCVLHGNGAPPEPRGYDRWAAELYQEQQKTWTFWLKLRMEVMSNLQETRGLSTLCWADVGSGCLKCWRTQHSSHQSSRLPTAQGAKRGFSALEQEHACSNTESADYWWIIRYRNWYDFKKYTICIHILRFQGSFCCRSDVTHAFSCK